MTERGCIKQLAWCELVGETERQAKFKRLGDPSKGRKSEWREGYHWKSVLGKPWIHYERVQSWLENWQE